jgi:hypothetical protein
MDDHPTAYTYDQAAAALGIHPEAVRARLRRNALRRGPPGNDGRPTVLLSPADIATVRAAIRSQPAKAGPGTDPDAAGRPDERDRTIKALEDAAAALRETLERERKASDQLQVDAARERDRAEGALIRAAAAEAEGKALREALEEARRPFWRRWIG